MHEYSIVGALLEKVAAEADSRHATAVRSLSVRIGELSGVEASLLASAYELFRQGTLCENAPIRIESVPARWECRACGREIARGERLSCPLCSEPAKLVGGDEILLQRIEMEVP